ncbi:MAG: cytochrome c oxidase assembly protein [Alphaproteobacteria bacterium]|nr:cytochrome c oxidase assembly protein [Alphaproteobacteria bacterium]
MKNAMSASRATGSQQRRPMSRQDRRAGSAIRTGVLLAVVLALAPTTAAFAHDGEALTNDTALWTWPLSADIIIPTALVLFVYIRGMISRSAATSPTPAWRHGLFFAGVAAVFLALQSPIDPIAERLFFVHQIQHLLLRMIGPMLLALSWPQASLVAGLPRAIRRRILTPTVSNSPMQHVFSFIAHPVVATTIFIGSLYVWQYPAYHDVALLNEPIHYLMHVTMLFAGLVFWWRIFDQRPAPKGLGYGVRLMMLWLAILSNIALGSYTTLKTSVLYDAYDVFGRLFGYAPLTDEQIGGVIIWIPSSMMCLLAVLIVIYMLGSHETRQDTQRLARRPQESDVPLYPTTGAALVERARPKNRAMAFGFAIFAATAFASAILAGVLSQAQIVASPVRANGARVRHALRNDAPHSLQ